tara:strand:- start:16 stop:735 length:720 start_codon:yes stop_codon:yes gene_type:complete
MDISSEKQRVVVTQLTVEPITAALSLKDQIYRSLKVGITRVDIYAENAELRLDERRLSEQLNISRTPVREALARLEQEGLVEIVPRRGVYIARKSKAEILDMVTVWAALESMAARLITKVATDTEIASLRNLFTTFDDGGEVRANIDEYSDQNIKFHQAILNLSQCSLLCELAENLFIHMRSIRKQTIGDTGRADKSIIDHLHIIEALEARDANLVERLCREHTMNLGKHIEQNVNYLV